MRDVASTSWTQVQTNVDMPHPTPPNPNLMRDVASTSWRKCKTNVDMPHPHPTQPPPQEV